MTPRSLDRLIYVDDSGHPSSGMIVYGWVEFRPDHWHDVLGQWLDHRKQLWRQFAVPVSKELHMTEYALGRGRISKNPPKEFMDEHGRTLWKDLGGEIARRSLSTIASIEGLRIGAVYRRGEPDAFPANRAEVYRHLVARFETQLQRSTSLAMVFMDGNGSDPIYREAHRALPRATRRVIEDPVYMDSRQSQLMQMADHVAWCANATITKLEKHEFAHDWYSEYLSPRDPERAPVSL